jgi:sugar lactone lactonase YvrE
LFGKTGILGQENGDTVLRSSAVDASIEILADIDALIAKTGMAIGDQAYLQSNNKLYLYNGAGWYLVATVTNSQPTSISAVESTYELANDGTATVITAVSEDPDGFPLTWSYAVTAGELGSTATVSQTDNVFTITPSTDALNAGEFSITFSVTDGATGVVSAVSAFTLSLVSQWTVDLSNMTYDSVSFSVTSQESGPLAMAFNTDGTKMYMVGYVNDRIYQYSLSTGFDLSTASYDNVSFSLAGQLQNPSGIIFNSDGTKVYITSSDDRVYQYSMSTAFDTSTTSYDNYSFSVNQDSGAQEIRFSTDGTKMYMIGLSGDAVYQYSLSTAFDISTASYDSVSFSVASQETQPRSLIFNTDGTQMFIFGSQTNNIYQYNLSTGFDLSTASYASKSFNSSSQNSDAGGLISNTDGTKFFTIDAGTDKVYQYSTGL